MREKFKKQKGITLIALIITIIVMLILAIVSINIIVNQGILTKSKTAVDEHQIAAEKETIKIGYSEYIADKYSGKTPLELKVANAQVSEPTDEGWTITFKTGNVYTLSADGKTIEGPTTGDNTGENEETLTDEEMQAVLQSFTANPENYLHSEQSSTNKDRAIGTDGQAVNLDLWDYMILNEENNEILLGPNNWACCETGSAYDNKNIVDGKIKGTVPQYIFLEEKNKIYTVTKMKDTFYNCTNLIQSPKIPNTVKELYGTFVACTNLTQAPEIPSSVTNMNFAFYKCASLTGIVVVNASNITSVHYCFANITNNIIVQVPENSTTYNTFHSAYASSSSNIEIEAIENQQVLSMLPTEEEKKEIIQYGESSYIVATDGMIGSEIGSDLAASAIVQLMTNNKEFLKILIYTPTKEYFYLFQMDYLGSELGSVYPDDKWYCRTYSDGSSTTNEYNGSCPISKDMFTEIYSESYLDRIIASFK